jgi:hypothetical protein
MDLRQRMTSFLIVTSLGLCLYLPLLSRNYDLNGLSEAAAVDAGHSTDLLNPNHMLYRPIGYLVRKALAATGIAGGTVPILQALSAIFGALGIGFVFLALERLTENRTIAIWTSLALGVSWSYWTLSTDVYYFSLSAMFVAATLALFVRAESSWSFALCGGLCSLSILTCQANVVLLPGLGLAILLREPSARTLSVRRIALLWGAAGAIAGIAFVSAGILAYGQRSIPALIKWASSYSGNTLPMYGAWTPSRVLETGGTAFRSVLGTELWMVRFAVAHLNNGELPAWVAPLGFMALTWALITAFRRGIASRADQTRTALWLLVLYCSYLPFIAWWEPVEPRWYMMPNVFLAALVGIIWSRWSTWPYFKIAMPATFLVLGGLNLVTSAWPRHFEASTSTQMAACVARQMKKNDLFLATEWNWAGYLPSIHNREVMSFIGEVANAGNKNLALARIDQVILDRQRQGAHVYMIDIKSYPETHMKWLAEQTGLTAEDLKPYRGSQTFECVYSRFFQLDARTAPGPQ